MTGQDRELLNKRASPDAEGLTEKEEAYCQLAAVTSYHDAHKAGLLAAAAVIQQAFAERDGEIAMLTEALRGCGRAVEGGAKEPRANVRFIVGETLQALAAKGDSRG